MGLLDDETKRIDRRDAVELRSQILQTVGGILLVICTGISSWTLLRAIDHGERIIRLETQQSGLEKTLGEMREDLKAIRERLEKRP